VIIVVLFQMSLLQWHAGQQPLMWMLLLSMISLSLQQLLPSITMVDVPFLRSGYSFININPKGSGSITNISHVTDGVGTLKWGGPSTPTPFSYPTTFDSKRRLQYFIGYSIVDGSFWLGKFPSPTFGRIKWSTNDCACDWCIVSARIVRYDVDKHVTQPNATQLMSDDCVHPAHIIAMTYDPTTDRVYAVNIHPDEIQVGCLSCHCSMIC
jgi:hypothetical protein